MKQPYTMGTILRKIHLFPLSLLSLSRGKRLLIAILSYVVAIPGLWFFFPRVENGASMLVSIICLCWLFRYRGFLISLLSTALAMGLIYRFLLAKGESTPVLAERVVLGFGIALLLGLTICWLRTAVDLVHQARLQTLVAQQERVHALEAERHQALAFEQQCQINALQEQFLEHVSHELRTPLTSLGGFLDLLKQYFDQLSPSERTHMLNRALANYTELVRLVNGGLDAATATGAFPPVRCESVAVRQVVQEVLTNLDPRDVQAYTFQLQVDEQVMACADPRSLYHVLQNLVSNVFKYVPPHTIVTIEAAQTDPSSPVYLSVQDAGPGIPPEELPLLFKKFVRLKRDTGGPIRGTGLGLSICKHLVEAMEGRIWVESSGRTGEGSRFCLTLLPLSSCSLPSLD